MRKNNKRALIVSALSLLLCVSMLVGSTMAWFTDNASTAVNTIQSGIIDLRLTDLNGNDMEGKTLNFVNVNGESDILWEPGATFMTEPVRLWNYSNLSILLDFQIAGFEGDMKLLEALEYKLVQLDDMKDDAGNLLPYDQIPEAPLSMGALQAAYFGLLADWGDDIVENGVTIPVGVGDPKPLTDICIIAHMKEEAGNEYQNLKLTGAGITFQAKQYTDEYDSYDNQYDKDAKFDIVSTEDAIEALKVEGASISVAGNIETLNIPAEAKNVTVSFNGADVDKIEIAAGAQNITLVGLEIDAAQASDKLVLLSDDHGTLTLKNAKLTGVANVKNGHAVSGGSGTALVLDGCEIKDIGYGVQDTFSGFESLTITNTKFENTVSWAILNQGATPSVTIDNCTFTNCQAGIVKSTGMQANGTFVFTNNTMTGCKEHNPYGLIQLGNQDTCNITWSGNSFDGAEMVNPFA